MTGQRLLAAFIVLAAAVAVVLVAWLIWFRPPRTVVRRPGETTVLIAPDRTRLPRDSIRETQRQRRPDSQGNLGPARSKTTNRPEPLPRPQNRRVPSRKRSPARTTPDRRRPSHGSPQGAQPSNPPSTPPPSEPPPVVTVPPPSVCVGGLVEVGDCP